MKRCKWNTNYDISFIAPIFFLYVPKLENNVYWFLLLHIFLAWSTPLWSLFLRCIIVSYFYPRFPSSLHSLSTVGSPEINGGRYVAIGILVDFSHSDIAPATMSTWAPSSANHGVTHQYEIAKGFHAGVVSGSGRSKASQEFTVAVGAMSLTAKWPPSPLATWRPPGFLSEWNSSRVPVATTVRSARCQ